MSDWFHTLLTAALDGDKRSVLFFVSLYCLLVCTWSLVGQMRIRRWTPTTGRLVFANVRMTMPGAMSDGRYRADALYEFVVEGERLRGSKVSAWEMTTNRNARMLLDWQLKRIQRDVDGGVRVFYNPRKPGKSLLILPGPMGLLVTFAIAVGPMVLWSIHYGTTP